MRLIFITSPEVHSDRWLSAFPDASMLSAEDFSAADVDDQCLVWLLLVGDWLACLEHLTKAGARVVAMTLNENDSEARSAITKGASGYIHALSAPEMLIEVEQVITHGGLWLGPKLLHQLIVGPPSEKPETSARTILLTGRERAVAIAVASGKSNKEVARELNITDRTVKAHLSACFDKLKVRDRMHLSLVMNR